MQTENQIMNNIHVTKIASTGERVIGITYMKDKNVIIERPILLTLGDEDDLHFRGYDFDYLGVPVMKLKIPKTNTIYTQNPHPKMAEEYMKLITPPKEEKTEIIEEESDTPDEAA